VYVRKVLSRHLLRSRSEKTFHVLLMPVMASASSAEPAGVTITLTMPDPAALRIQ
jgi:hypothetical protein